MICGLSSPAVAGTCGVLGEAVPAISAIVGHAMVPSIGT